MWAGAQPCLYGEKEIDPSVSSDAYTISVLGKHELS